MRINQGSDFCVDAIAILREVQSGLNRLINNQPKHSHLYRLNPSLALQICVFRLLR